MLPVLFAQALVWLFVDIWDAPMSTQALIHLAGAPLAAVVAALLWFHEPPPNRAGISRAMVILFLFAFAYAIVAARILGAHSAWGTLGMAGQLFLLLFRAVGTPLLVGFALVGYILARDERQVLESTERSRRRSSLELVRAAILRMADQSRLRSFDARTARRHTGHR